MSHIDELIAQHCPNGVSFQVLGDVTTKAAGIKWSTLDTGEERCYIDLSSVDRVTKKIGETLAVNSSNAPSRARQIVKTNDVIFATTRPAQMRWALITPEYDDQVASTGYCVLRPRTELILPAFLAHVLGSKSFQRYVEANQIEGNYPSIPDSRVRAFKAPVPPLEVQRAIVEVLDTFSKLEAELEAELEARKQQYEHYRAELLAKAAELGRSFELGELGRIVTGRTPKSSDSSAWGDHIDFVTPSDIKNGMKWIRTPARRLSASGAEVLSKAIVPQGSLLVTCIGADMGKTVLNGNPCATNQQINSLTLGPGVDTNFVFHVLTSMRDKIRAQGERAGGTMPIINKSDFSKIRIALPSFEEQQRIAGILDQFDALVNDLSVGLPAELAARRQQYEYYRDKLLTFKELEVAA